MEHMEKYLKHVIRQVINEIKSEDNLDFYKSQIYYNASMKVAERIENEIRDFLIKSIKDENLVERVIWDYLNETLAENNVINKIIEKIECKLNGNIKINLNKEK